ADFRQHVVRVRNLLYLLQVTHASVLEIGVRALLTKSKGSDPNFRAWHAACSLGRGRMPMNKFVVVILSNEAKANEAADVLHSLHRNGSLTLYGLAIARKADDGDVTVVEQHSEGVPGAGVGALAGALVGLIGGPVTALLGAAGGAWIGTWRDVEHLGISAEFLDEVANALAPGVTALVADVSEDRVAFVDEQMERLGGVVLREWQSELPE